MPSPDLNEPVLDLSPSPGHEVKATTCYMCACRCGIKVWLRDGAIRYLQGNAGLYGIGDGDRVEVTSHHGTIRVQAKCAANMHPDTAWTWNAIGKRREATR